VVGNVCAINMASAAAEVLFWLFLNGFILLLPPSRLLFNGANLKILFVFSVFALFCSSGIFSIGLSLL
jgi:hypothetical protein